MVLHQYLLDSARQFPEKTALKYNNQSFSYSTVRQRAGRLALFLAQHGLERGDRVAIYLENSPESVYSIFGTLEAGGCFVVINPSTKADRLRFILQHSGARFLICDISRRELVENAVADIIGKPDIIYCGEGEDKNLKLEEIIDRDFETDLSIPLDIDLAALIYTSGSTAEPKGVTLTHRNMVTAAEAITSYIENRPDDIILNVLPLSFDYGLYQVLMAFKAGCTLVLHKGFSFPGEILRIIKEEKITGLPVVPTMLSILFHLRGIDSQELSSVRYVTSTGAAVPESFFPRIKKIFPRARIFSMYGLTECKRVSYLPPELIDVKPGSVGIPMPGTEVFIVDKNDRILPPGKTGQLVVRGGTVMQGYWRDPEGTAKVLKPGRYPWEKVLYTGDLFMMDEDGCLYFISRMDDLIKSRGERVSPKTIENALYGLEGVQAVRVSGVSDEIIGNAIKAEIVLREGYRLRKKDVIAYCRSVLEDIMVPRIIKFVRELPMTVTGKIRRNESNDDSSKIASN